MTLTPDWLFIALSFGFLIIILPGTISIIYAAKN